MTTTVYVTPATAPQRCACFALGPKYTTRQLRSLSTYCAAEARLAALQAAQRPYNEILAAENTLYNIRLVWLYGNSTGNVVARSTKDTEYCDYSINRQTL